MTIDPADFNVLTNAFRSIAAEMGDIMLRSAHSSIVREAKDCSTCLTDAGGRTVAQSEMIPVHMNSLAAAFDYARRKYDITTLTPEEAIITNNPYENGQHLNDIILLLPVFHEGELCAFTGSICHHLEVGGAVAGSNVNATEIYHEGIVLPTMRINVERDLYDGPVEQILAANVRLPDIVIGDFHAQLSSVLRGRTLMQELIARHGLPLVREAMRELQSYSERMMRETIAALPDGEYYGEDVIDGLQPGDPPVTVRARVRIEGDRATVDLSETDDQVTWPINAPIASTESAVLTVFGLLLGPDVPTNDGTYRPISVVARRGSLLNPVHPQSLRARMTAIYRVVTAVKRALGGAVPEKVAAAGNDCANIITFSQRGPRGYQMFTESVSGGYGAGSRSDGADVVAQSLSNTANTPVESIEMDHDFIRLRSYELIPDSGGAGRHRGGLGIRRVYEITGDNVLFSRNGDRQDSAPWGLDGGQEARRSATTIRRGNETIPVAAAANIMVRRGDVIVVETSGGGGFGNAADRDRALVRRDLEDGRVTREAALATYGLDAAE